MKHRYLLFALLWLGSTLSGMAQQRAAVAPAPVDSVRQYLGNMFANVDKSQIPAPYLEEYGYRFLPLRLFNGVLVDSNRTTLSLWRQLYATVVSGNINGPDDLPALANLNAQVQAQVTASSAIPVIIQRLDYAVLRSDAITAGLFTGQNDQLFDVPGRTASPYLLKTLFAAAPARNVASTGTVSFVFTQGLYVQSGGLPFQSVSLDFGDGRGYQLATWGQPLTATYTSAGTKRVKVKVTCRGYNFGGGLTPALTAPIGPPVIGPPIIRPTTVSYESQFDLQVLDATTAVTAAAKPGAGPLGTNGTSGPGAISGYVYHGGTDSIYLAPTANHSGGWVHLVYGGINRNYLTKPLIVAEGYDPSRIAPAIQSNYSVRDFLRGLKTTNPNTGFNFSDALGNDSSPTSAYATSAYDLVFIDYNNGTDDIRRNAALFEQVVQYVNAHKQGGTATGQQNVVLGVSMGGLVARYGLAEMEKAQPGSTHTRLLVTHDSPHRGANTPLGLQALTRQSASTFAGVVLNLVNSSGIPHLLTGSDVFPELQQGDLLLDEPATQQLLLVRATVQRYLPFAWASTYGVSYNSFLDGDYRAMITPPAAGFPYRFIATSLGSQCGKGTLAPYDELVRITGEAYLTILVASAGIHTEIIVNALPNPGQVQRLSGLRVWIQTRVLIFSHKNYLSRLDYQSPANNPVAWDGLPGGVQYINGQIALATGNAFAWKLYGPVIAGYAKSVALANTFCFVPSASALDVPVLDNNTTRASFVNGFTSSTSPPRAEAFIAETPFYNSSIGATAYNYQHPFIPGRYGQWIYNEMERPFNSNTNPVACDPNPECSPGPSITGPSQVCPGTTAVFQLSSATATWTATPSNLFTVTTSTGSPFATTAAAGAQGTGTITATPSCGPSVTKTVTLGSGEPSGSFTASNTSGPLRTVNFITPGQVSLYMNQSDTFTFTSSPAIPLSSTSGSSTSFYLDANSGGVQINATSTGSACGLAGHYVFTFPTHLVAAPNPANATLTVALVRPASPGATTPVSAALVVAAPNSADPTAFDVDLYDTYGRKVKSQHGTHSQLVLDVHDLPNGLYNLRSGTGKDALSEHIQITH